MSFQRFLIALALVAITALCLPSFSDAGQVWTKCHITCRCLHDNSVGNFDFVIPVDVTADIGFDADLACKVHGNRVCADSCNGTKYSYTYQVTSP